MTYSRSSHFTVPSTDFDTKAYTCIVKHTAITKTGGEQRPIQRKSCPQSKPEPIQVHLITPDCNAENTEATLELTCVLFNSGPGQADVEWLVNGAVQQPKEQVSLTGKQGTGYSSYIRRTIAKNSWDKGDHYTCRVTQLPKPQNVQMFNTSKCQACYKSVQVPTISITKPSYRDLLEGAANVTCLVKGSFLEKTNITWNINGRPSTEPQAETVKTVDGGRQNAESRHPVSLEQWERGTTFQCKVATMCFEEITKDVTIKKDPHVPSTKPIIRITQAYREVSSDSPIAQMLVCEVSGFSPMEITISWKKNNMPLSPSLYDNGPVVPAENAYSTYSILKIGRNELGDSRDSYTCVVYHSSSAQPITTRETLSSACYKSMQVPTVSITKPSYRDLVDGTANITCLVEGSFLEKTNITWNIDGRPSTEPQAETVKTADGGQQNAESRHPVSLQQWKRGTTFQCKVVSVCFEEITKDVTIKKDPHVSSTKPIIRITQAYREVSSDSPIAQMLVCEVSGFSPMEITISWKKSGRPLSKALYENGPVVSSGKFYSTYSILKIGRNELGDSRDIYTCMVYHSSSAQPITTRETLSSACYKSMQVPTISITKPSYGDLVNGTAKVTCLVEGSFLEKTNITWNIDGRPSTEPQVETVKTVDGRRQNAESIHSVSLQQWKRGTTFQCKVATMCFEEITKNVTIKKDTHVAIQKPVIKVSQAYREVSSDSPIAQMLVCEVSGFSPMEITISWKKNNMPLSPSLYDNGPVVPSGKVYSTYSILKIGRNDIGDGSNSYICMVYHSSSPKPIPANETISSDLPKTQAPTVELLQSVVPEKKMVVLKCIASNYWPGKMAINWTGSPQSKDVMFTEQQMANGTYTASSQLKITFSQWQEGDSNSCEVVHKDSNFKTLKRISRKDWIMPTPLMLSLSTEPHCPALGLSNSGNITLLCSIHGYLEGIQVTWEAGGEVQKSLKMEHLQGKGAQFYTTSNLTIPLEEWNKLQEYTCRVTQLETNITQTSHISKCTACKDSIPPPSLYLLKPSLEGLFIQKKALLNCLVVGYELARGTLSWRVGGDNRTEDSTTGGIRNHENQTQSLESKLVISREAWNSRSTIQCLFSHPCSLFPNKEETIQSIKDSNTTKVPSLSWVTLSPTQLMQPTSQAVAWVVCTASGFFPAEILFQWMKNDSSVDASEYVTGSPVAEDGNATFTTQSILKIPASEWESRTVYTCMVGHESSPDMQNKSWVLYGMVSTPINTTVRPPSFEELFINKSAALTCMAPVDHTVMNWTVSWIMDGEPANMEAVTTEVLNKTTSASWIYSQLLVSLTEWKTTKKFTCSIFTGLREVTQFYERHNGTMKKPKVYLQHQSSKEDLNVTLLCLATDFYPGEVFVKWQQENTEMSLKGHNAQDLKCDHERERCSLLSILEVPRSQWMMGISYTCLIAHVSSPNIVTKRANSHSDSWDCAVTSADICVICNETVDEYNELSEIDGAWNRVSTYLILFLLAVFYGGLVTFFKVK